MYVIPITCIVRTIQAQSSQMMIITTRVMLMLMMLRGIVNGGQTQITHILCLLSAPRLTPSPLTTILYQITMMKR